MPSGRLPQKNCEHYRIVNRIATSPFPVYNEITMKKYQKIAVYILGSLMLAFLVFSAWTSFPAPPGEASFSALESGGLVTAVQMPGWIIYSPEAVQPETGLIFYPGGNVDFRAYSPLLWKIAQAGYVVMVPDMPFNLAVFSPNKANQIISAYPQITSWVIGGHSLGGAMAARFALDNPDAVEGLVLWASYPASSDDLSQYDLHVTSIYASSDGLTSRADIDASRALLPPSTIWVEIEGGNHAQFGDYGTQKGDNAATITAEEQWEQVISATLELMEKIAP
jgi:dienelactone hydrolase